MAGVLLGAATGAKPSDDPSSLRTLTVSIEPRNGASLRARVQLEEVEDGLQVEIEVRNANPGDHPLLLGEGVECNLGSSDTSRSEMLGSVPVNSEGRGRLMLEISGANLRVGAPETWLGRALIVFAPKGSRQAGCGVIEEPLVNKNGPGA